jgi:hypothetical protein
MPPRVLAISAPMPLCVAVFAPCGLLLLRVDVPCVPSAALSVFLCLPRICGATRLSLAVWAIYAREVPISAFPMSRPAPKKGGKKPREMQGEQNTVLSSKAIKKISGFCFHPFGGQGVMWFVRGHPPTPTPTPPIFPLPPPVHVAHSGVFQYDVLYKF